MTDSLPMGSLSPYCSNEHGCCGMHAVAQGGPGGRQQQVVRIGHLTGMHAAAAALLFANLQPPATMQHYAQGLWHKRIYGLLTER